MQFEILYPGSYALLKAQLEQGEHIKAEAGAMASMSDTIDVEGKLEGGLMSGLARTFLTGETLFFQTLRATRGSGDVLLAPSIPGDLAILDVDATTEYFLQKDAFMAGESSLILSTKAQNLSKGLFGGEGFFIQKIAGHGKLVISSFGSIHRIDLKPGETRIVDNGHMVAWPTTTSYSLEKASKSGWISSFTSGEGIVCKFTGPGYIYIQTRNTSSFGQWLQQFIPKSR